MTTDEAMQILRDRGRFSSPKEVETFFEQALKAAKREGAIEALESIPTNKTLKVRFAETEYALEIVRKESPDATMQSLREANIEADGWERGYEAAIKNFKEWRDEMLSSLRSQ